MRKTNEKNNKGITLIALIITIIVMLILVAVTITMAVNGGLFDYAGKAKIQTIIGIEKEKINLGITQGYMKYYSEEVPEITEELIKEKIENEFQGETEVGVIKKSKDEYIIELIDNKRTYLVKNNEIELLKGVVDKVFTVTSSEPIKISNLITRQNIEEEVGIYEGYEIIGISSNIEGPYSSDLAIGNSGTLTVEDIKQANYKYTLNEFMDGDDVFYCKILINDEVEKIQKITMKQANEITYEEDFVGFIFPEEYAQYYTVVEDARFSKGKAIKIEGQGYEYTNIRFNATCTRIELLTMIPFIEDNIKTANLIQLSAYLEQEELNNIHNQPRLYDLVGTENQWNIRDELFKADTKGDFYFRLGVEYGYVNDSFPILSRGNIFYFDAIVVTK